MNIPYMVGVGVLGWKRGGVSEEGRERGQDKCVFELRMMRFKMCRLGTVSFFTIQCKCMLFTLFVKTFS